MVIKRLYCMYYPDHIRFVLIYVIKTIIGKFYVGISFLYHKERLFQHDFSNYSAYVVWY